MVPRKPVRATSVVLLTHYPTLFLVRLGAHLGNIEKAIVSNLTAGRGRTQRVTFAKDTRGSADKHGKSVSTDRSRSRHTTAVAAGAEGDYQMCRHRTSHSRPECRLAKVHEEKGLVVSKKDK